MGRACFLDSAVLGVNNFDPFYDPAWKRANPPPTPIEEGIPAFVESLKEREVTQTA
jgi:hypothetical protein